MPLCQYICNLRRGSQHPTALKGRTKKHQKNDISRDKHPNGIGWALNNETTSYLSRPRNKKKLGALRPPHLAGSEAAVAASFEKNFRVGKSFAEQYLAPESHAACASGKRLLPQVTAPRQQWRDRVIFMQPLPEITSSLVQDVDEVCSPVPITGCLLCILL